MAVVLITAVKTRPFSSTHGMNNNMQTWCRKHTELRNAIQAQTSISKFDNTDRPMVNNKLSNTSDYYLPFPSHDNCKRVSAEIIQQLQRDFEDAFNGNWVILVAHLVAAKARQQPYQLFPNLWHKHYKSPLKRS